MPKIIKLKSEPKEPKRETVTNKYNIHYGDTLAYIIQNVPDNAEFITETSYYDSTEYFFAWDDYEDDKAWAAKLALYNKKLEEYTKWFLKNKDDINFTIAKQKESKLAQKIKEAEKKKASLEKELNKINKVLKCENS